MAASAKPQFQADIGSMTLYAYQLLGLRPTSLLQEHMESARMATNMLLSRWSAEGINLWEVEPFDIPLFAGQGTYLAPDDIVGLLDVFIRQGASVSQEIVRQTQDGRTRTTQDGRIRDIQASGAAKLKADPVTGLDRIMMSIGRTEYASYPNKKQRGFPTVFWFNQQIDSTINIWPTPNDNSLRLMGYYLKQIPAVGLQTGGAASPYPEIPLYFQEAFVYGLASRLAIIWVPEKAQMLDMLSKEAYQAASEQNVEDTPIYFSPQTRGYFV